MARTDKAFSIDVAGDSIEILTNKTVEVLLSPTESEIKYEINKCDDYGQYEYLYTGSLAHGMPRSSKRLADTPRHGKIVRRIRRRYSTADKVEGTETKFTRTGSSASSSKSSKTFLSSKSSGKSSTKSPQRKTSRRKKRAKDKVRASEKCTEPEILEKLGSADVKDKIGAIEIEHLQQSKRNDENVISAVIGTLQLHLGNEDRELIEEVGEYLTDTSLTNEEVVYWLKSVTLFEVNETQPTLVETLLQFIRETMEPDPKKGSFKKSESGNTEPEALSPESGTEFSFDMSSDTEDQYATKMSQESHLSGKRSSGEESVQDHLEEVEVPLLEHEEIRKRNDKRIVNEVLQYLAYYQPEEETLLEAVEDLLYNETLSNDEVIAMLRQEIFAGSENVDMLDNMCDYILGTIDPTIAEPGGEMSDSEFESSELPSLPPSFADGLEKVESVLTVDTEPPISVKQSKSSSVEKEIISGVFEVCKEPSDAESIDTSERVSVVPRLTITDERGSVKLILADDDDFFTKIESIGGSEEDIIQIITTDDEEFPAKAESVEGSEKDDKEIFPMDDEEISAKAESVEGSEKGSVASLKSMSTRSGRSETRSVDSIEIIPTNDEVFPSKAESVEGSEQEEVKPDEESEHKDKSENDEEKLTLTVCTESKETMETMETVETVEEKTTGSQRSTRTYSRVSGSIRSSGESTLHRLRQKKKARRDRKFSGTVEERAAKAAKARLLAWERYDEEETKVDFAFQEACGDAGFSSINLTQLELSGRTVHIINSWLSLLGLETLASRRVSYNVAKLERQLFRRSQMEEKLVGVGPPAAKEGIPRSKKKTPKVKKNVFTGWDNNARMAPHTMNHLPSEVEKTNVMLNALRSRSQPRSDGDAKGDEYIKDSAGIAKEYIINQSIHELFQFMLTKLLVEKPNNPLDYLIDMTREINQRMKVEKSVGVECPPQDEERDEIDLQDSNRKGQTSEDVIL